MPAQPLTSVIPAFKAFPPPACSMGFGGDVFRGRPKFAELVSETIASWAQVEAGLGGVLASLIDVSQGAAITLFEEMKDVRARVRVIKRLAEKKLTEQDSALISASLDVVTSLAQKRHDFAHNIWGFVDLLPDSILLAHPTITSQAVFSAKKFVEKLQNEKEVKGQPFFDYRLIHVYKLKDLEDVCKDMQLANFIVARVYLLAQEGEEEKSSGRDLLRSEPRNQSALSTNQTRDVSPP